MAGRAKLPTSPRSFDFQSCQHVVTRKLQSANQRPCLPHVCVPAYTCHNERARTMRLSALGSARANRCTENLSHVHVLTTSRYSLSCVRPAAAPHSCSTKRSKPFKEATAPTRTLPLRHQCCEPVTRSPRPLPSLAQHPLA